MKEDTEGPTRWFHWSTVTDSGFTDSTCHTDSGKIFQTMTSEPKKKKKKGSMGKVSDYKESIIISKRHFHTLLDRKQSAAPPENETFRKNRKTGKRRRIFDRVLSGNHGQVKRG